MKEQREKWREREKWEEVEKKGWLPHLVAVHERNGEKRWRRERKRTSKKGGLLCRFGGPRGRASKEGERKEESDIV